MRVHRPPTLPHLPLLLLLAVVLAPVTAPAGAQEAPSAPAEEEAREAAALEELRSQLEATGAPLEVREKLERQVVEFYADLGAPLSFDDFPLYVSPRTPENEEPAQRASRLEAARELSKSIHAFYLETGARQIDAFTPVGGCESCYFGFSDCLDRANQIVDDCLDDLGEPTFCLSLQQSFFRRCSENFNLCLGFCAI